jgi:hypothetical protein
MTEFGITETMLSLFKRLFKQKQPINGRRQHKVRTRNEKHTFSSLTGEYK